MYYDCAGCCTLCGQIGWQTRSAFVTIDARFSCAPVTKREMSSQKYLTEQQFSRFRAGDKAEFKRVYDQYFGLVHYVAKQCGLQEDEALDVVQETFLNLYKSAAAIEAASGLKYWLVTTVRNKSLDCLRRQKVAQKQLENISTEREISEGQGRIAETLLISDTLVRELEVKLLGELLVAIELDTKDDTFTLFYQQGLSAKQIAEVKGEPISTVTNRISRNRKKFREAIEARIQNLHDNVF